ncbi:MAG: hypothetical protein ABI664_12215 [bacterium]
MSWMACGSAVLFVQLIPFDRVKLHKSFRDAIYGRYVPAVPAMN